MRKFTSLFIALVLIMAPALASTTQSNVATISLTATVPSSLTVSVSQSSLSFADSTLSSPINITTSWNLASGQATQINTAVYFASSPALTGPNGATILPSEFICVNPNGSGTASNNQVLGGITFPFTCPFDWSVNITSANLSGTNTTPYQFQIPNLLTKTPGTYTGTLNVQALAF